MNSIIKKSRDVVRQLTKSKDPPRDPLDMTEDL